MLKDVKAKQKAKSWCKSIRPPSQIEKLRYDGWKAPR